MRPPALVHKLLRDVGGATAIEYGLIVSLLSLAVIGGVTLAGSSISSTLNYLAGFFASH